MARRALRFELPGGRVVRLLRGEGEPIRDDVYEGERLFAGRLLEALRRGVLCVQDERGRPLPADAWLDWPLPDLHALRDAAYRLGAIEDEPPNEPLRCSNCDRPLPEHDPRDERDFERWYAPGDGRNPTVDGPVDASGSGARRFELRRPIRIGRGLLARHVDVRPVRVREVLPLWRALGRDEPFEPTAELVRAMGIVALGRVRDAGRIARALAACDDEAWADVERAFLDVQYSPRAFRPAVCGGCGAIEEIAAPESRELSGALPEPAARRLERQFPSFEQFGERTRRIAREVFEARGIEEVPLVIDGGTPWVDASGSPVWGTYTPRSGEAAPAGGALITIYYETFRRAWAEGRYDVDAEIRETIEHEVEHHLFDVGGGADPKDVAERDEAELILRQRLGARALRRARWSSAIRQTSKLLLFLAALAVLAVVVAAWLGR
ncbi:MAG: metallopeptidase family protein [Myxococcota bacterium]|nr:metallopeptidase family protein [Myxococcota bacterium]MDW8360902.1 metallopeptidase family protein [Myxococcales bacterium]